jgi:hypothetical protein
MCSTKKVAGLHTLVVRLHRGAQMLPHDAMEPQIGEIEMLRSMQSIIPSFLESAGPADNPICCPTRHTPAAAERGLHRQDVSRFHHWKAYVRFVSRPKLRTDCLQAPIWTLHIPTNSGTLDMLGAHAAKVDVHSIFHSISPAGMSRDRLRRESSEIVRSPSTFPNHLLCVIPIHATIWCSSCLHPLLASTHSAYCSQQQDISMR